MTPKEAIDKLRRMQKWGKMTEVKREALDVAIQAIERHDVEKEVVYEVAIMRGISHVTGYRCPSCLGLIEYISNTPKYCSYCGQKLKKPRGVVADEQD